MNFTLVELSKISLAPGEVLTVKLYGDDYEPEMVDQLQNQLKSLFPKNKIMMFVLPVGHDLQMEKISDTLEDSENKELTPAQELVDALNATPSDDMVSSLTKLSEALGKNHTE